MKKHPVLISIIGPTAVGKTATAIQLAKTFNSEIISADSRQFFKEISIGTAKPSFEEQRIIKHHFINNKSISEDYNASDFENEVIAFLHQYFAKNNIAIMCGGSGLYIDAVIKGFDSEVPTSDEQLRKSLKKEYEEKGISFLQEKLMKLDPEFCDVIDLNNSKRLLRAIEVVTITGKKNSQIRKGVRKKREFQTINVGLNIGREKLYERINTRVDKMIEQGLLEEVKSVIAYKEKNALRTVGYSELFSYLEDNVSLEEAIEKIKVNSRRYAKRQITWFKKMEGIEWFHPDEIPKIIEYIRKRIDIR